MSNAKPKHNTSLVGISGDSNEKLSVLGNLYYEPFDPESVVSVVASLAHKPDVRWTAFYTVEEWCTSLDQSAGGSLFLASMEGTVHHYSGGGWDVIDVQCPDGLNSVWACGDREAFAVGVGGERIRIRDGSISTVHDADRRRLNAIHGCSTSSVFAVGDGGLIYWYDGNNWNELDSPTNVNLLSVLCVSDGEVYIGGAKGVLLRWNGSAFDVFLGDEINISGLAVFNGLIYIAAGLHGIYSFDGHQFVSLKDIPVYRIRTVGDRLFVVGNRLVAQFDGSTWWGGEMDL